VEVIPSYSKSLEARGKTAVIISPRRPPLKTYRPHSRRLLWRKNLVRPRGLDPQGDMSQSTRLVTHRINQPAKGVANNKSQEITLVVSPYYLFFLFTLKRTAGLSERPVEDGSRPINYRNVATWFFFHRSDRRSRVEKVSFPPSPLAESNTVNASAAAVNIYRKDIISGVDFATTFVMLINGHWQCYLFRITKWNVNG
jgi:hypothetical protein